MSHPPVTLNGVTIDVRGTPRPQGSMQLFRNGGAKYSDNVYVWRGLVTAAVLAGQHEQITGAVELHLGFDLPRPSTHYLGVNTKRSTPEVNPRAPTYPTSAPDLDKLVRCVCDAITDAGLWKDDAQVTTVRAAKRYAPELPGVLITVIPL